MAFERDACWVTEDSGGGELARLLTVSSNYLRRLWPERPSLAQQLEAITARLTEERLRIAVLGQFKRGKSTFLNALLGQAVLPTGLLPLTAVPTFLRDGPEYCVEVDYLDGRAGSWMTAAGPEATLAALRKLVTEEGNPRNAAGIARVQVRLPAPLLAQGIELVDTPGIGSTLQHNTDAAFAVLPECDAAFFVVSVDPPVTAAELDYLDRLRAAGIAPIVFVLNKVDYLDAAERAQAAGFLRRAVADNLVELTPSPIIEVSAREALAARAGQDDLRLERSGLPAVERYLANVLARHKRDILHDAVMQKAGAILAAAEADAALALRTLELPLADLADRSRQFGEALQVIERQRVRAADLLAGDRKRLHAAIEMEAEALREDARGALIPLIDRAFTEARSDSAAETSARQAIATAIPDLFGTALEHTAGELREQLEKLHGQHIAQAEEVVGSVRRIAAQLLEIPAVEQVGAGTFATSRQPYWVTQKWEETLNPFSAGVADALMPRGWRRTRLKKRLATEVTNLVARNAENLRWATLQNADEAFRRFAAWFDAALADAIAATGGAIEAAHRRRVERAEQAAGDLVTFRDAVAWIGERRRELAPIQGGAGRDLPAAGDS